MHFTIGFSTIGPWICRYIRCKLEIKWKFLAVYVFKFMHIFAYTKLTRLWMPYGWIVYNILAYIHICDEQWRLYVASIKATKPWWWLNVFGPFFETACRRRGHHCLLERWLSREAAGTADSVTIFSPNQETSTPPVLPIIVLVVVLHFTLNMTGNSPSAVCMFCTSWTMPQFMWG
jgi:hypothetical protein